MSNGIEHKTEREHLLTRPDMYVGSVKPETSRQLVLVPSDPPACTDAVANATADGGADAAAADAPSKKGKTTVATFTPEYREVSCTPGFLSIVNEILVNAADNKVRDPDMTYIKVELAPDTHTISVENNGRGIPVRKHDKHPDLYEPEMAFGMMRTSDNYDDDKKRLTGGRNGYGAKATNVFSTFFEVETNDAERGLYYKQTWRNNMADKDPPVVKKATRKTDFTKVTFQPDYARFGMQGLDADTVALLIRRVHELTAIGVSVYLQGEKLECKGFRRYAQMVHPSAEYVKVSDRWEVAVGCSGQSLFMCREHWHSSLVNAVPTDLGGTHVDHVVGQLVKYVVAACAAKKVNATPAMVKRAMHVFVNCQIENPTFESQTKRQLTLPAKEFGSKCELTSAQLKTLLDKTGVVAHVVELASAKEFKDVAKALTTSATSAASRSKRLVGVPKLDDANEAGGKQSAKCTLILTEGDSAKALAVAGLSVVGRDHYGVFPLRGKLLNVREATAEQLKKNAEIGYLVQILGLRFDVDYADPANFKTLRYGRVCIMSDQDLDGSHIRGLIINFFGHFWPSLLKRNDFLSFFVTPIRSFSKGGKTRYCLTAEESLRVGSGECAGWAVKYYKGLGSSTAAEAKMYFKDMKRFIVALQFTGDDDLDAILLAFAKARANDRKTWLAAYDSSKAPDYSTGRMTYRQFVDTELVHFSAADNVRSIPSVVDGLKPAHRQVLWTFLKRNLTSDDNKVAAVAGQIITDAAYHHGEASLHGTIVGMAQDYMGSGNNINLLVPNGQFGTRHQQGKDAASARYIFTGLSPLARLVFPPEDDAVLTYVESDGKTVQPLCYVPVIPMVLVNGTEGIGTGWSTSVPPHDPLALIDVLERWLQSGGTNTFDLSFHDAPWYRGFKGTVVEAGAAKWQQQADAVVEVPGKEKYIASGCRTITDVDADTELHDITELPPGMATQAFRETLEAHFAPDKVVDFKEMHTDTDVHFAVTVNKQWAEAGKVLSLERPVPLTNMVLFRPDGQHLSKFDDRTDILRQFAQVRLDTYGTRKHHQMATMARDLAVQERKATFILYVKAGKVDLQQARATVEATLTTLGLAADWDAGFNDLLDMPLSSLTLEKVAALKAKCDKLRKQLQELSGKSEADLWLHDLAQLRAALQPPAVVESKSKRTKLV